MSGLKNFAVAGAGNIGKVIIDELLKKKDAGEISSVTVLTRTAGSHEDLSAKGAKIIAVDYSSQASLESAFAGIDVVISSLPEAFDETKLAAAAKAAGVKLVVPSDYAVGPSGDNETDPLFNSRLRMRQKLKELPLPYAVFWTGLFPDMVLAPGNAELLGLDFAKGQFAIPGSGTAIISWTTTTDVARFIAHVLTALPKEKLEWKFFRIEGDRIGFNDIVSTWEERSRKVVSVSHRPRSELEEEHKSNPAELWPALLLEMDLGRMIVGRPGELSNGDFPQWKPAKVIDVLTELYGK